MGIKDRDEEGGREGRGMKEAGVREGLPGRREGGGGLAQRGKE